MDLWSTQIPSSVALAVVATLGYWIGRRGRNRQRDTIERSKRTLRRAQSVARELENIAWILRRNLSRHQASLVKFKHRASHLSAERQEEAWKELCREAEEVLRPTVQLATQIADACDLIRRHSHHLMTFTGSRTDPLTGVFNRRGLDDALAKEFARLNRYELGFSVAIFDIDHFRRVNEQQGHVEGDRLLKQIGRVLNDTVRETDVVARCGGEEFVVVMPQTDLAQASLFAERFRKAIEKNLPLTASGGIAAVLDGDTADTLLGRADAALYGAKTAGRNSVFRHNGERVESIWEDAPSHANQLAPEAPAHALGS
ncbi:MAG: GGDEF domain-containing protein [Planctomycetota bacterium]